MSSVVLMLSSDNSLPIQGSQVFFTKTALLGEDYSSRKLAMPSINEITFTMLEAR